MAAYPPWSVRAQSEARVGVVETEEPPGSKKVLITIAVFGLVMLGTVLMYAKYPSIGR